MSESSSNIEERMRKSNLSLNRGSERENLKNGGKVISIGMVNTQYNVQMRYCMSGHLKPVYFC